MILLLSIYSIVCNLFLYFVLFLVLLHSVHPRLYSFALTAFATFMEIRMVC